MAKVKIEIDSIDRDEVEELLQNAGIFYATTER